MDHSQYGRAFCSTGTLTVHDSKYLGWSCLIHSCRNWQISLLLYQINGDSYCKFSILSLSREVRSPAKTTMIDTCKPAKKFYPVRGKPLGRNSPHFAVNDRAESGLKGEAYFFGKFLRDFFIGLLP